ncbi:MAG: hypothetical protein U1F57_04050 [bacterium]
MSVNSTGSTQNSNTNYDDYENEDYGTDPMGENTEGNYQEDPESRAAYDLTRQQWLEILNKTDALNKPNEKDLLAIIRDAIRADEAGDVATESQKYQEIAQALGQDADSVLGTGDAESGQENAGDSPTKVENGVNYYEGQKGQDYHLTPAADQTEDRVENEVTTDGNVTITPLDPNDAVTVSGSGASAVVDIVHEGKTTRYTVDLSHVASLHIASDNVKGSAANDDNKITTGTQSSENFVSGTDRTTLSQKVANSVNKIGTFSFSWTDDFADDVFDDDAFLISGDIKSSNTGTYGLGWGGDYLKNMEMDRETMKNWVRDKSGTEKTVNAEADAVKPVLTAMSKAMGETDPSKRQELWKEASDAMGQWKTQDQKNGGTTNDQAQLFFDVLYGELGEEGFKQAISSGLIPSDFANQICSNLESVGKENTDTKKEIDGYQWGGPGWSHETSADFIRNNSTNSQGGDSSE